MIYTSKERDLLSQKLLCCRTDFQTSCLNTRNQPQVKFPVVVVFFSVSECVCRTCVTVSLGEGVECSFGLGRPVDGAGAERAGRQRHAQVVWAHFLRVVGGRLTPVCNRQTSTIISRYPATDEKPLQGILTELKVFVFCSHYPALLPFAIFPTVPILPSLLIFSSTCFFNFSVQYSPFNARYFPILSGVTDRDTVMDNYTTSVSNTDHMCMS